jgi:hypothetical protein
MNLLAITHHNGIRIAELGFAIGAVGVLYSRSVSVTCSPLG